MESLQIIRNTAAEVLAAAVLELHPDAVFLKAGATSLDFFADFIFSSHMTEEKLVFIEEKMREITKRDLKLENLEMEKNNAAVFLAHSGQHFRAREARQSSSPVVPVLRMGSFADMAGPSFCRHSRDLKAFKLQKISTGDEKTRIGGIVERDPSSLRRWVKELKKKRERDHIRLGEELALFHFSPDGWLWTARGEKIRFLLHQFWREQVEKKGYQIISTSSQSSTARKHLLYHTAYKTPALAEWGIPRTREKKEEQGGLLNDPFFTQDRFTLFCGQEKILDGCRSSLQFIEEILRIFDFKYQVVLRSRAPRREKKKIELLSGACYFDVRLDRECEVETPRLEFEIADLYGRWWPGPFIAIEGEEASGYRVAGSIFGSIEGWIALSLEKKEGSLSFMTVPDWLRVVALGKQGERVTREYLEDLTFENQ